ncbi:DUF2313 domain-containing protein [Heliobacillus mobilis]|uniref:DUF2313 domain-containing protein n=1 Tax=Heliobacterium mobile TaxID=28064 RepID=A0A6I3SGD5_HELMO|nr:putative phage tail protein [Heliobacterium mobile]MTV47771.1 DUF2313 domain-containing protein [Heliobacterium mobile]
MGNETDLMRYLPHHYSESRVMRGLQGAVSCDLEGAKSRTKDIFAQYFLETATWGLKYWEQFAGLPIREDLPSDQRRSRIIAKLTFQPTMTKKVMESIVDAFLISGKSHIEEFPERYAIKIFLPSDEGFFRDLIHAVDEAKPAHIDVGWSFEMESKVEIINHLGYHLIITVTNNPWSIAPGDVSLFLDGAAALNGDFFLSGRNIGGGPSGDGPGQRMALTMNLAVNHFFGVFSEYLNPVLDGRFNLDGTADLNSVPDVIPLAARQMVDPPKLVFPVSTSAEPLRSEAIKVTTQTNFSQRTVNLNGNVALDGSVNLDRVFASQPGTLRVYKQRILTEEVAV